MTESPGDLRPAKTGDVDCLLTFMQEFYAESGYPLEAAAARSALQALAGDPGLGRVWMILHDGQPVGYVAVAFGFSLEYLGRDAFIDDFYIRPAFRHRGIGGRVLARVLGSCRNLDVRALHLEVERGNRPAQALYRRHGFRDNDRQLLTLRLAPARAGVETGS